MTFTGYHSFFQAALDATSKTSLEVFDAKKVFGGDINLAAEITTNSGRFFIKWQNQQCGDLFIKEQHGLETIEKSGAIKTPKIIGNDHLGGKSFLILEWIEKTQPTPKFWENFADQIAQLHQKTQSKFGLDTDNYIGKIPQVNTPHRNWIQFLIKNRLEHQVKIAVNNGSLSLEIAKRFEKFYPKLNDLLTDESPALIHGDLWSGNFACIDNDTPVVFDPAVYFGHREMEIAFTQLFGGFDNTFYLTYKEAYPLTPGFENRSLIYHLYPLLVHHNLFGGAYIQKALAIIKRFS